MMSNIKNTLKIAFVYIGTVLGAGFASGQEMLKFFTEYGLNGIYGLILTGTLFFIIGWAVLELSFVQKAKTFREFIKPITGDFIGLLLEWVVIAFMFICFGTMLAGSGALIEQKFNLSYQVGIIIMAISCFITFLFDVKGIVAVNAILAPILLVGCFMLGLYIWIFKSSVVFNNEPSIFYMIRYNWLASSILYISYNSVTAIVVLTTLHNYIKNKKIALYGSLIAGIGLGLLGVCLGVITLINYNVIQGDEIPMLTIVMQYAPAIQYIYLFVLLSAMFTTAVANGYGIVVKIKVKTKKSGLGYIIIFIFSSIMFAQIGFSNMVGSVYPVFGYIGFLELLIIIIFFIKYKLSSFVGKGDTIEKKSH